MEIPVRGATLVVGSLDEPGVRPAEEGEVAIHVVRWPATGDDPWVALVSDPGAARLAHEAGASAVCVDPRMLGQRVREAWDRWTRRVRLAALERLFELSPVWQEITDPDIRLVDVNPAFEAQSGLARAESIGRTTAELLRAGTHGPGFYQGIGQTLSQGGVWRGTMIARRLDGGLAFQHSTLAPVTLSGRRVGFVAHKQVPTAQLTDRNDVQSVRASLEPALAVVADERIVDVSASLCRLLGVHRRGLVERASRWLDVGGRVGGAGTHRTRLRGSAGDLPAEVTVYPAQAGSRDFAVWHVRDIREQLAHEAALAAAKEAAEAASQAKSTFLAQMSHELRTPLNAILGYAELVGESDVDDEVRHDVDRIHGAALHLLSLVNELLDMARIESGQISVVVESVALQPVLDAVRAAIAPLAAANANRFTISPLPPSVYVRADASRLLQVLLNLLANACRFTRGGHVALEVEAIAGEVRLAVRDTGVGMTPEEVGRLFQPYVQTASGRQSGTGTGLGLAISKRLVQQMDGQIDVISRPGVGSCFTVVLKAAQQQPA